MGTVSPRSCRGRSGRFGCHAPAARTSSCSVNAAGGGWRRWWPGRARRSGWRCGRGSCWPRGGGSPTPRSRRVWGSVCRWCGPGGADFAGRACRACPPVYGLDAQLLIVATVTAQAPQADSHWTHRGLAEHLAEPVGISASQIGRILASLDLKPHRVRGWLNRPADPAFAAKARAVCQLYLHPPAGAVLFSLDEKTSMQAKSRKNRTRPIRPGRPEQREFEYVRHGTVSLLAAMNVTDGTVHPKIITRNDSTTFIAFCTELAASVDPSKKIHLILDNGSSHTSKQTKQWLAEHPRITVTYTPTHASWLNMIELSFSILTRRML